MRSAKHAEYFPALTGLRGIAAFCVMVFHAPALGLGTFFVAATAFFLKSYVWVDFFFLLSGFVIAHAYGKRFREEIVWSGAAGYLRARFARIYPLHFVMLLALIGLELVRLYVGYAPGPYVGKTFDRVFALGALLPNVLLVQALGAEPVDTWNVPSWSISCEAAVYLLFPFLYLCLSRSPRRIGPAMAGAGAVLLLGLYWIRQPHNLDASVDYGFVRCLAEFSLGICLYELAVRVRLPGVLGSGAAALAVLGAVVAAMHFDAPDLLLVPLFCLLILVAISNEGWFSRVLTSHPLQRLGDISYSIYLVHFPVLVAVDLAIYSATGVDPLGHLLPLPIRLGTLAGVIGLTLVFSSLTYRFIEVPCRKLIRGRRRSGAIRPRAKALPIAPAS